MNKENRIYRSNDVFPQVNSNSFWNDLRKSAAENHIPIHGHFEITPRCNLNCKMCYVHLDNTQMGDVKELSLKKWKANGQYLRKNQWRDTTVRVLIDLD